MAHQSAEPIAPCVFCGTDPAPFLYTTPICPACAQTSQVRFAARDERFGLGLAHDDGRWHWLSWSEQDSPKLRQHYATQLERRAARQAVIATGRAAAEDPEFLANIDDYIAQVGITPTVERALQHQREAAETSAAVAEAERLLGLRS